jgi:phosphoribosylformylglycinamidine synthase
VVEYLESDSFALLCCRRLGGTALAQVFGQIGDEAPDVEDFNVLKGAFNAMQALMDQRLVQSGHDISDGV